jgi:hypothetical protein
MFISSIASAQFICVTNQSGGSIAYTQVPSGDLAVPYIMTGGMKKISVGSSVKIYIMHQNGHYQKITAKPGDWLYVNDTDIEISPDTCK